MTTYQIPDGTQVETFFNPDASTSIVCPACQHLTPNVQLAQLMPDVVTSAAAWIDCACMEGHGESRFNVPLRGCDCYLRFRVQPSGAGNRYFVAGVDYPVMDERRQARATLAHAEQDVVTLDPPLVVVQPIDEHVVTLDEIDEARLEQYLNRLMAGANGPPSVLLPDSTVPEPPAEPAPAKPARTRKKKA